MKNLNSRVASIFFLVGVAGCSISLEKVYLSRAQNAFRNRDYRAAVDNYQRLVKGTSSPLALKAAQEGARISNQFLKDYEQAATFLKFIILVSKDEKDLISAQKQLAELYFEKTGNYAQALIEYSRLLQFPHTKNEEFLYKLNIAKANFYLGLFDQALSEVLMALKLPASEAHSFEAERLNGNILMASKRMDEAISVFSKIIEKYPVESKAENVALTLAVCYEEKNDFTSAIGTLEKLRATYPVPEFIDFKIERMKERRSQLPGARGLRK